MKAIVIREAGGPEVLQLDERPAPRPGPDDLLVTVRAAAVNFFDTVVRRWAQAEVPGLEGAGVVAEIGPGVTGFAPGDRVAWMSMSHGSYAEQVVVSSGSAIRVPDGVDDETAAALVVSGATAHHHTTVAHPVQPGDVALVLAAAGSVGLFTTQLVKARGGTVIAVVSRPEKTEVVTAAGADHVVVSTGSAFVEPVRELTGGEGVHVVYDAGGAATFYASMEVLRAHGTLVFYATGLGDPMPALQLDTIPRSIRITYPNVEDHLRTPAKFATHVGELFSMAEKGELNVRVGGRYPLAEAARAHVDIASRGTTGKLLLIP
ncbi:quinone oxidoreductase [Amycolatopsis sp. GM8]|uniref:quinone oxidoreductase family protein n=1 Tax=Amycolatopsis sp. GM8 TaxID=2896530 RepID=UPI001F2B342E|nr:quinone oxidoreductase [Amycolatopsis sp. GM8]